jgi:hypothetical protein
VRLSRALLFIALWLLPSLAVAQSGIQAAGSRFTPGHTVRAMNPQGTALGDAGGSAGSSLPGQGYLTELGITNTGLPLCINDALTNAASGYHQLCLGASVNGATMLSANSFGGAPLQALTFNINNQNYGFPFNGNGNVLGPVSGASLSYVPLWNSAPGGTALASGVPTGQFWSNFGANSVTRAGDRLLVGLNTNVYSGTNAVCTTGCSWVSNPALVSGVFSYLERNSQVLSYSQNGEMAGFFASRTSDDTITNCCSQAVALFQNNNNTASPQSAWGLYSTSVRQVGAGGIQNEFEIGNLGSVVPINPYNMFPLGLTADIWLGCGGEAASVTTANRCSAAIGVFPNNKPFDKGIVFADGSLNGDGVHYPIAIEMPLSGEIKWTKSAADPYGASITATSLINAQGLVFNDFGLVYNDMSSGVPATALPLFSVNYITSSTNWPTVSAATGNNGVTFGAASNTNTNVDVGIHTMGTGAVVISYMPTSCSGRTTGTLISTTGHGGAVTWC